MSPEPSAAPPARSGVRYPPPIAFAIPFTLAWLLDLINPMPLVGPGARATTLFLGAGIMALGLAIDVWAVVTFRRAKTAINPLKPASSLVRHGPYRFTRNPMYVGLTALYVGLAILVNSFWPFLFLPVSLGVIYLTVIRREERYLTALFGAAYDEYRRQVRRWI